MTSSPAAGAGGSTKKGNYGKPRLSKTKSRRTMTIKPCPAGPPSSPRYMSAQTSAILLLCFIVLSASWANNMMSVPIPRNFKNPWILRLSLAFYKVYTALHDVVEYVWDANFRWVCLKKSFVTPPPPPETFWLNVETRDQLFDGVPVRVYQPVDHQPNRPGILFIHGGGWTLGSVQMYDPFCRALADAVNAVVVSVEYRLAPEYWYPTPLNDCEAAARYFMKHAALFNVDPDRIAIVGDSAGGNLAASVNLRLRDDHCTLYPPPRLQVLLYPALQALDLRTPSYQHNKDNPILSQHQMAGFWLMYAQGAVHGHQMSMINNSHTSPGLKRELYTSYLNHDNLPEECFHEEYVGNDHDIGDEELWELLGDRLADQYFSPLVATNLTNLPKTFIMTMGLDVLRDDGILYAQRLSEAGNDVTHLHYESGFHGLISYPIPLIKDCHIATQKLHDFMKNHL